MILFSCPAIQILTGHYTHDPRRCGYCLGWRHPCNAGFMRMHKARVVVTSWFPPRLEREVWETKYCVVRSVSLQEDLERVRYKALTAKLCCSGGPGKSEMSGMWNVCQIKVQEAILNEQPCLKEIARKTLAVFSLSLFCHKDSYLCHHVLFP